MSFMREVRSAINLTEDPTPPIKPAKDQRFKLKKKAGGVSKQSDSANPQVTGSQSMRGSVFNTLNLEDPTA